MDVLKRAMDVARQKPTGRSSTSTRIHNDLRQRILSLELPPGTSLLRSELAEVYKVSQTPLRDALQRLEQEELVQIFPQSGTVVTLIDVPKVKQAYFLRLSLETEVARHLAEIEAAEVIARCHSVLGLQRTLGGDGNQLRLFQEMDEHFHGVLFRGAGQSDLHDLIRVRSGHLDRLRRLQPHSEEKIRDILEGHRAILDAIERKDPSEAMAAAREHLRKPDDWVEQYRVRHPAYFA